MAYQDNTTEQQMRALAILEDEVASTTPKKWKLEKTKVSQTYLVLQDHRTNTHKILSQLLRCITLIMYYLK